jgi:hypothetical protein
VEPSWAGIDPLADFAQERVAGERLIGDDEVRSHVAAD